MKIILFYLITCFLFISCNQPQEKSAESSHATADSLHKKPATAGYFPVTDYFRGQLAEIRNKGINPLKLTKNKNAVDSSWIKMESLESEFILFLSPEIDSSNMTRLFKESKFLDQTIDAYTFSYDPYGPLPDSMKLMRWDVYINPETNSVSRVYLVKKMENDKMIQLTWLHGKSSRIVTISNEKEGKSIVETEITIKWDF